MATTEDRLQQSERLEDLWEQSPTEPARTRVDTHPPVQRASREFRDWSHPLLVAWIATIVAINVFEPRPTDPTAIPLWGTILMSAFIFTLFGSFLGLANRRRWGLGTSALAGVLGMVLAGACAVTGHHTGSFLIVEGVAFTGIAAGSVAALRARR
jgi:hypothetical protein